MKNPWKLLPFVLELDVAAEQRVLYPSPMAMLSPMKVDQDIIHYHAPVEERLPK